MRSARLNFPLRFFHNYLSLRPGILMETGPLRAEEPMPSCGCEWVVQTCVIRKQIHRTLLWKDSRGSIKIRQRKQFKKCAFMRWRHFKFCTYEKYSFYSQNFEYKHKNIKTTCVCVSPNGNTDRPVVIFPHFQSVFLPSISFGSVISESALTNRRYWAELSRRALS